MYFVALSHGLLYNPLMLIVEITWAFHFGLNIIYMHSVFRNNLILQFSHDLFSICSSQPRRQAPSHQLPPAPRLAVQQPANQQPPRLKMCRTRCLHSWWRESGRSCPRVPWGSSRQPALQISSAPWGRRITYHKVKVWPTNTGSF